MNIGVSMRGEKEKGKGGQAPVRWLREGLWASCSSKKEEKKKKRNSVARVTCAGWPPPAACGFPGHATLSSLGIKKRKKEGGGPMQSCIDTPISSSAVRSGMRSAAGFHKCGAAHGGVDEKKKKRERYTRRCARCQRQRPCPGCAAASGVRRAKKKGEKKTAVPKAHGPLVHEPLRWCRKEKKGKRPGRFVSRIEP